MTKVPRKKKPDFCSACSKKVGDDHWFWMPDSRYLGGGAWRCKVLKSKAEERYREKVWQDPVRRERHQKYCREYHLRHPEVNRFKAYKALDKKMGRDNDLTLTYARVLMASPCSYCGITPSGGIDRKDSKLGHTVANSAPACEVCNFILGDLSLDAKLLIAEGLQKARCAGYLDDWVIPTKRNRRGRAKNDF